MYLPLGENLTKETGGLSSSECINIVQTNSSRIAIIKWNLKRNRWESWGTGRMRRPRCERGHRNCSRQWECRRGWSARHSPGPNEREAFADTCRTWHPKCAPTRQTEKKSHDFDLTIVWKRRWTYRARSYKIRLWIEIAAENVIVVALECLKTLSLKIT